MKPHEHDSPEERTDDRIDPYRRFALKVAGTSALLPLASGIATADSDAGESEPELVRCFDPDRGEFPENIAIDEQGTKYITLASRGEVAALSAGDNTQSTLATLDLGEEGVGTLGVEVDPEGTLYTCLVSFDSPGSDTHGVWQVSPDGTADLFAALDPGTFPNDIALEGDSLLVTDSLGGQVLRVTDDDADEWLNDPLLDGDESFGLGFPVGANGIAAAEDGTIHVANTERGRIVRVPVNEDGSAGTPTAFVEDAELVGSDGIAFDSRDNLYVAVIARNELVRVAPDGSVETLADESDGLDAPSDVAFGTTEDERTDLFFTNFAFPEFSEDPAPSLMKLDVGIPGPSVPR